MSSELRNFISNENDYRLWPHYFILLRNQVVTNVTKSAFSQAPEKFTHVTKFVRDYLGTLESNTYVFRDSQQNKLTYEVFSMYFLGIFLVFSRYFCN